MPVFGKSPIPPERVTEFMTGLSELSERTGVWIGGGEINPGAPAMLNLETREHEDSYDVWWTGLIQAGGYHYTRIRRVSEMSIDEIKILQAEAFGNK